MLILSKKTKAGNQIIPTYNYSFAHRKKNEYVDRKKGASGAVRLLPGLSQSRPSGCCCSPSFSFPCFLHFP